MGRPRIYDTRMTFPTRLLPALRERVETYRSGRKLSRNRLIELALEEYLDRHERPAPLSPGDQPLDWRRRRS